MMSLKYMFIVGVNKFTKSQKKINHLMYMDGIKIFAEIERNGKIW